MTATQPTRLSQLQAALAERWNQHRASQPNSSVVHKDALDRFVRKPTQPSPLENPFEGLVGGFGPKS